MAEQPQWRESVGSYLQQAQAVYKSQEVVVKASLKVVLSVFAVAFFGFFALRPTLNSITTLLKRIEDQKEISARLDKKIAQLSRAEEVLSMRGDLLTRLVNRAIPGDPRVERFAQQLEVLANEEGVVLTGVDIQEVPMFGKVDDEKTSSQKKFTSDEKYEFITFGFTAGGEQEEIIDFLDQLEKMERVVLLSKVSFSKPERDLAEQLPLLVNGKGTVYYLPINDE